MGRGNLPVPVCVTMDALLTAAGLGLSFGNLWICVLLVFSLQSANRATAAGYLAGRAAAIVALCVLVAMLGRAVPVPPRLLHAASGAFLLVFAAYLLALHVFAWVPPWKRRAAEKNSAAEIACDHHCATCALRDDPVAHAACGDCADHGICSAEEPEVRELTAPARRMHGKAAPAETAAVGFWPGVVIGVLRGAALCGKLVVLLPLLMTASIVQAAGMGTVFALTSSLYPLLGFAFGAFALRIVQFKKPVFWFSSAFLVFLGGRMLAAAAIG